MTTDEHRVGIAADPPEVQPTSVNASPSAIPERESWWAALRPLVLRLHF